MVDRRRLYETVIANQVSDTTAPTVTITSSETSPTSASPIPIAFTLSEPSTDFAVADVTVGHGTLSGFAGSGTSYTVNATPDGTGALTIDVAAGAFHDAAGNANLAATQFAIGVTYTLTVVGAADTELRASGPTVNRATAVSLDIGELNSATDEVKRMLIKFDLTNLPASAIISSTTLSLYLIQDFAANASTFSVYRQKRAWVEAQATWNIYSTGNNWATAGGFGANDCEQTPIGSRSMTAAEAVNAYKNWTLTAANKAALTLGNGWLIKSETELDDGYRFASTNDPDSNKHPKLVVVYTVNP